MCGIAGYLCLGSCDCIDENHLRKMEQAQIHRGPDDSGIWVNKKQGVGFSFRRLSIIDLSPAGAQPMSDREGTVTIIFNGEIYNHRKLRAVLEQKGYTYSSHSDTESIIYAYKEWGIEFLHKLEGMFAIALFDHVKNELYLIRDRIGVKPLYFSTQGNKLSFASEIKALWQLPWMKKELNPLGLYHCLTYMVTPAPMTLYKGVYKMPSSYYAKVDSHRNITFHEWYNPLISSSDYEQKFFNSEDFCVENIRKLLREAVEKRMVADVPVGGFLSGGIDSSLTAGLMSEFSGRVKTFNIAFSDFPENDERMWAQKVAKHFNTEHHEIVISEKDAFSFYEKMVHHQDEPIADCVCIPLYYVSKLARDNGVIVVLVGEGSDELFCGYSFYGKQIDIYHKYWNPSQKMLPRFARRAINKVAQNVFPHKTYELSHLQNWAEGRNLFWGGAIAFPEYYKGAFFNIESPLIQDEIVSKVYPGFNQSFDSYNLVQYHLQKLHQQNPDASFLDSMIYLELKHRLPELLLTRVDKMTMACSVEGRVPFLDHKLVEFALRIPPHLKYKNGVTKYILKKAAEGILPHDVIYRKKVGFGAPITRWFRSDGYFNEYFLKLFNVNKELLEPWVDSKYVLKLHKDHQDKRTEGSVQLWTLQNILASLR